MSGGVSRIDGQLTAHRLQNPVVVLAADATPVVVTDEGVQVLLRCTRSDVQRRAATQVPYRRPPYLHLQRVGARQPGRIAHSLLHRRRQAVLAVQRVLPRHKHTANDRYNHATTIASKDTNAAAGLHKPR